MLLMVREAEGSKGGGLIYLVRYNHSIIFGRLLGTKQWRSAYICFDTKHSARQERAG